MRLILLLLLSGCTAVGVTRVEYARVPGRGYLDSTVGTRFKTAPTARLPSSIDVTGGTRLDQDEMEGSPLLQFGARLGKLYGRADYEVDRGQFSGWVGFEVEW